MTIIFTLYIAVTGAPIHLRTHRVRRSDARIALATSCYLRCCGEGQHAILSSHGDKGDAAGVIRCADILDSSFEVGGGGAAATTTNEYTCYGHPDALLVGIGGRSHMPCRAMGCGGRGKAAACSICPRPRGEPELTIAALYYFGRCVSECPEGTVRSGFTCTCAYAIHDGRCVDVCPDAYWNDGGTCVPCLTKCRRAGHFASRPCAERRDTTCEPCHDQCAAGGCAGPRASQCSVCAYASHRGVCVARCPDGMVKRLGECVACLPCRSGEYRRAGCSGEFDSVCVACTGCSAGSFAFAGCDGITNSQCRSCATCALGYFASGGCAGFADSSCGECSTCSEGKFAVGGCGGRVDTECRACRVCEGDDFPIGGCRGAKDTECSACPLGKVSRTRFVKQQGQAAKSSVVQRRLIDCERCASCPVGSFRKSGCNGSSVDSACAACRACPMGTYRTGGCSGADDTVCVGCTPPRADEDVFLESGCDGITDARYRACHICAADEVQSHACRGETDRECVKRPFSEYPRDPEA